MIAYESISAEWKKDLCLLFNELIFRKFDQYFHPHPLTDVEVDKLIQYNGEDLYFLQTKNRKLCGYGFLRGWDEGFAIPSLGLVIHPDFHREGLAKQFLMFLHEQALSKGSNKVRLTVVEENISALRLYQKVGYQLTKISKNTYEGFIRL